MCADALSTCSVACIVSTADVHAPAQCLPMPAGWYGRLDAQGRVVADFPVPLKEPVMMHDMALTQRHAILLDTPLLFDPKVSVSPAVSKAGGRHCWWRAGLGYVEL